MDKKRLVEQSNNAYNQWKDQWREHAKIHSKMPDIKNHLADFINIGVGKACVVVANGASLEHDIETLRDNQDNVDIIVCDKAIGHLLDNGITPTYCMVCDANVSYEKYLKPWKDKLGKTILFSNVCGNPEWTKKENANWKSIYFYINMDVINSHLEFQKLSGCQNMIPAATNVSNAIVTFLTQCSNKGRENFCGYDKLLLTGFDYCWSVKGNYYAFDKEGMGKRYYMNHMSCLNTKGDLCYTSQNLAFSCEWLTEYIKMFKLFVFNCSQSTILNLGKTYSLKDQIGYNYNQNDRVLINSLLKLKSSLTANIKSIENDLKHINDAHILKIMQTT